MTTYHLIELKYQGATNYKGSRFKLSSLRFPGDSLTVSLSYKYDSILPEALEILKGLKFRVSGYGYDEKKGVYIICSTTFEPLKEKQKAVKMLAEQMSEKYLTESKTCQVVKGSIRKNSNKYVKPYARKRK